MNPFAVVEDACAAFVERTFARIFPSDVTAAQIARKLVATIESTPAEAYLVRLHPRDVASLGEERAELETAWSALLTRTADRLELTLPRPIRVIVHEDEAMVAGTVTIEDNAGDEEAIAAGGYALRVVQGLPLGTAFPVAESVAIGRGRENAIDLVDLRVSRKHANVAREPQGIFIEDQGSTNGTYVNGERIERRRRLEPGDVVEVGDTKMRVEVTVG